jgi:molybdenum cofactor cytidylyltransferase
MKFGPVPPRDAEGATAVHTIRQGSLVLKKGTLIGAAEIAAMEAAGIKDVVVARLEPGDVSEDHAAAEIAKAVAGAGVHVERAFTGRANLFAEKAGILVVDREAIDGLNRIDEAITFATLSAYKPVVEGEMIATVKIIPFGTSEAALRSALAVAKKPFIRVAPYKIKKIGVVSTVLPGLAVKVIEKTLKVMQERLDPAGARIVAERRVPHEQKALAKAVDEMLKDGAEMVVVFGASAIADRRDVIPAAIEAIGGRIEHFGMPVDPGNLMLIGETGGRPVIGAPGCARSPKENGFDWILMRMLAGLPVSRTDITGLGVGGLLMEIVTRPQPRAEPVREANRIAAVILAAGRSTRMGGPNKLLAEIGGRPLVRIAREVRDRRHRPSTRQSRGSPEGTQRSGRAQSELRRWDFDLGENRAQRRAAIGRRRDRLSRRHAAGACKPDRQAARCLRSRTWCVGGHSGDRREARQSGGLVAALLPGTDGDRGGHRRAQYDRALRRGGGRGAVRRHRGAGRCRHAGSIGGSEGRA